MTTQKLTVDAIQGETEKGINFGYIMSEEGGYFFSYVNGLDTDVETLIGTLDEDSVDAPDFEESDAAAALRKWDAANRPRHLTV